MQGRESVALLTMAIQESQPPPPRYRSIDHQAGLVVACNRPVVPIRTVVPVQNPGIPIDEESETDNFRCLPCCDDDNVWRTTQALGLGQLMSICLCGTAVGAQLLSNNGFNAPAAQNSLNYFLLAFVYGAMLVFRNGEHNFLPVLRKRGWKYFLIALCDVEANYVIVHAYQYTTLTSIQLLDCSTIPIVMVLSFLFLSVRYLISHLIGVAICMVGIACVIYADSIGGNDTNSGSNPLLGDLLCVASTFLYGISNVSQEFLIKEHDRFEYLGFIGIFGSLISGLQFAILERKNLATVHWDFAIIGALLLFTVSMFAFYSMVSVVVEKTSALMFNLAALTADFYSLLASLLIFHYSFKPLYLVSFMIVIVGSIVYSLRKTEVGDRHGRSIACRCCQAICPCFTCFHECRPTSPYTVHDITGERSVSMSLEPRDTSLSSSD